MRELMRRMSFSDRVGGGDGGGGGAAAAVKRGLMRRLSFSDRVVGDNGGGGGGGATPPRGGLLRRLSFSDRAGGGGGGDGVPRGCVPVMVGDNGGDGDGGGERFVVRVEALRHPAFAALLEKAAQEFGYKQEGILRVPCDVSHFQQVLHAATAAAKS
uniref:Auxin-responsive protein n=1 Tax=Oryza glumipatula TaxID=40148 RepID=A0A0E0AD37_9ORYZ